MPVVEMFSGDSVSVTYFPEADEYVIRESLDASPEQIAAAWESAELDGRWVSDQYMEGEDYVHVIGAKIQ